MYTKVRTHMGIYCLALLKWQYGGHWYRVELLALLWRHKTETQKEDWEKVNINKTIDVIIHRISGCKIIQQRSGRYLHWHRDSYAAKAFGISDTAVIYP